MNKYKPDEANVEDSLQEAFNVHGVVTCDDQLPTGMTIEEWLEMPLVIPLDTDRPHPQ